MSNWKLVDPLEPTRQGRWDQLRAELIAASQSKKALLLPIAEAPHQGALAASLSRLGYRCFQRKTPDGYIMWVTPITPSNVGRAEQNGDARPPQGAAGQ